MGNTLRIICPNLKCRTILSVPDSARGKSVRCRACGTRVAIPVPRQAPEASSAVGANPPGKG